MRITVVGAGAVGGHLAFLLAQENYPEIVLIDIKEGRAIGKALDIMESAPLHGFTGQVWGSEDINDLADSDIIVMTAGISRKPGMSRDGLIGINLDIVKGVTEKVKELAPETILILVTNPLDITSYAAMTYTGFPPERVLGMAGVLESARYRYFIAKEAGVVPSKVEAMILGPHGDKMVFSPDAKAEGEDINKKISQEKILAMQSRARKGGGEILELLKDGTAYYAPAASVAKMVRAIANDTGELLPASVFTGGAFNLPEVYTGLPIRLGASGIIKIEEDFLLPEKELTFLREAALEAEEILRGLGLK